MAVSRGRGSCGGSGSDGGPGANGRRICLLALHNACLAGSAIFSVCSACRLEPWQRLACGAAGDVTLTAAGGPGGLDFAFGAGSGNASDMFGLPMGPVLAQLADESKAWSSIGWLLAAASVTTVCTLVTVMLKKFCGRARALAMTFVVALLILLSMAELLSAIGVFLAASQRLRAVFDSVAAAAAKRAGAVAITGRTDNSASAPAGLALAASALVTCLADLALLALKRLAFDRGRQDSYELEVAQPPPPPQPTAQRQPPRATEPSSSATRPPRPQPRQQPQPPAAQSTRRLTSLAGGTGSQQHPSNDPNGAGVGSSAEQLRRRLERRHDSERRRHDSERRRQLPQASSTEPALVNSASAASSSGVGGIDNPALEALSPSTESISANVQLDDVKLDEYEELYGSTVTICRPQADATDGSVL